MTAIIIMVIAQLGVPGIGGVPSPAPSNAYVAENGAVFYVAEDGVTFYVQET